MKGKTLCLLFLFMSFSMVKAENADISYGIQLGLGAASVKDQTKLDISEYTYDPLFGMHFGGLMDVYFADWLGLELGLNFTNRGAKVSEATDSTTVERKYNVYYLQMPLLLTFRVPCSDDFSLLFQAGPYGSVGFVGKYKRDNAGEKFTSNKLKFSPDYGLKISVGAQYKHVRISAQYDWGFANFLAEKKYETRYFCIAASYIF